MRFHIDADLEYALKKVMSACYTPHDRMATRGGTVDQTVWPGCKPKRSHMFCTGRTHSNKHGTTRYCACLCHKEKRLM